MAKWLKLNGVSRVNCFTWVFSVFVSRKSCFASFLNLSLLVTDASVLWFPFGMCWWTCALKLRVGARRVCTFFYPVLVLPSFLFSLYDELRTTSLVAYACQCKGEPKYLYPGDDAGAYCARDTSVSVTTFFAKKFSTQLSHIVSPSRVIVAHQTRLRVVYPTGHGSSLVARWLPSSGLKVRLLCTK